MDRRQEITKHITKGMRGIEVGPWFNPLAPKKDGFNCVSLDVFNTDVLREGAKNDPLIPNDQIVNIEEVDIVGAGSEIETLVDARQELGQFDYIISSHNFEHLPNPIKFLRGCGRVLKPNGLLSMAVPDKRTCFDYFRPHSTLGQLIEAFFEDRKRPTLAQVFEQNSLHSRYRQGTEMLAGFGLGNDPNNVVPLRTLEQSFLGWKQRHGQHYEGYDDLHCSIFTPASFELLMCDLAFLGLISFQIMELSSGGGNEFFVQLKSVDEPRRDDENNFYDRREELLHRVVEELGENTRLAFKLHQALIDKDRAIADQRRTIEEILGSRSWRITEPIRRTAERIRALSRTCLSVIR